MKHRFEPELSAVSQFARTIASALLTPPSNRPRDHSLNQFAERQLEALEPGTDTPCWTNCCSAAAAVSGPPGMAISILTQPSSSIPRITASPMTPRRASMSKAG